MRFGRYTILSDAGRNKNNRELVLARCDCGTEKIVQLRNLRSGNTQSCGCLNSSNTAKRNFKHGNAHTPTWWVWYGMMQRCGLQASGENKAWYFERGIRVCARWHEFENFFADMGERPEGMQLDRKDNDGGYSPENCRWATPKQNARNRRTNNVLTHDGKSMPLCAWAEELGWPRHIISNRLRYGWPVERALTQPPNYLGSRT